eukprot:14004_1
MATNNRDQLQMAIEQPVISNDYEEEKYEWREAYTQDGRKYYQNDITKVTQWNSPYEEKYESSTITSPIASPIDGISNGWYTIQDVKSGLVFDIVGGSKNKKSPLQLSEDNKTPSQTFFLQKLNDNVYVIKNKGSGLYLQINTGFLTKKEGAELRQYPQNNNKDSQQFTFINIEENIYNIETKCANKYININGASTKVGARVQQYTPKENSSQKFRIIPVKTGNKMVNGWYTIQNIASGLVLEVPNSKNKKGIKIQQAASNNTDSQAFYIEKINDKYYTIKNEGSKLYFAIFNQNDRTKLQQYPKMPDNDSQQFTFIEVDKDIYYIQSKISDKYIDVHNGSKKVGIKLQQLKPKICGTNSQKFRIVPAIDGRGSGVKRTFAQRVKDKIMNFAMKQMEDFRYQMKLLSPAIEGTGFELTEIKLVVSSSPEILCTINIKYQDKKWNELGIDVDKLNKMGKTILNGLRDIDKKRRLFPIQLNSFSFGIAFENGVACPKMELSFSPEFKRMVKEAKLLLNKNQKKKY